MFDFLVEYEGPVLLWIQNWLRFDWLDDLVIGFSALGNAGMLWLALCAVFLLFPRTRRAGALGLAALAMGFLLCNGLLKPLLQRDRPSWLLVHGLKRLITPEDDFSFPSGHTCAAFAAAWTWRKQLPYRWMGLVALVAAVLMGLSRLYLGVHFPTDVLAGAVVGIFASWAMSAALNGRKRRK